MNTHLLLLWNSVFAPRAAVDLAKQHPNTTNLAWTYVAALIVATFLFDIAVLYFVRPFFGTTVEQSVDPFSWSDTLAGLTIVSILATVFLFVGQRWFWQKFAIQVTALAAIDAAIIAGFAVSLVLLFPTYVANEATLNSSGAVLMVSFTLFAASFLFFSTVYFSHALGLTLFKSFWLNLLFFLMFVIVFILLLIFGAFVSSALTGIPFDQSFQDQGQNL